MTEQTVTALVVAALTTIPPTLMGLAALIQGLKNGNTSRMIGGVLAQKADAIHELADGNLTELKAQLATALARIQSLETLVTTHRAHDAEMKDR